MARIRDRTRADLPAQDQDLLQRDIALYRTLSNNPDAMRAFSGLGQYIRHRTLLDARLRELAILQVGWVARSPYEWSHHIKIGYDFGVTDDDIRALIAETAGQTTTLDAPARLVLRAAREAAAGPGVAADTYAALAAILDEPRMVDLVVTIAFYCGVVRLLASFEIEVEPEYQPYLDRFPLIRA
ncbi:MAG: carboxymuconolactone decarboxylase family protein [Rubritepida sp.]|nr:carboxymuconolactone decarboxylase family protein [Rubritepida sp.]